MSLANPAGDAARAAAPAYIRALLDALGDREPFQVLEEQADWLARRVAGVDEAVLRRPEAPGKWSVAAVVQHLADSEIVCAWRLRVTVERDQSPIQAYDQDAWSREFRYDQADLPTALLVHRALRAANVRLWRSLTPAQLARAGVHSERGPESAAYLIPMYAGHDLVHRRQIDRILEAAGRRA